jgi:hypothetical protein
MKPNFRLVSCSEVRPGDLVLVEERDPRDPRKTLTTSYFVVRVDDLTRTHVRVISLLVTNEATGVHFLELERKVSSVFSSRAIVVR